MSSHTTNIHYSPEYHASLRTRFCPECATPVTFYPPSHTVQSTTSNSSTIQSSSGSSYVASILPSSGPASISYPSLSTTHTPLDPTLFASHKATSLLVESVRQGIPANQLVQLPVGLPVVKPQKGRRRGLHVSSVANALVNAANSNNSLPTAERTTTVQPSQNAPQQQVRIKTRKTKLPPPILPQLVYDQRD